MRSPLKRPARLMAEETGRGKSYVIARLEDMEQQNRATESAGTWYQGADEWQWCGGAFEPFVRSLGSPYTDYHVGYPMTCEGLIIQEGLNTSSGGSGHSTQQVI